MWKAILLLGFVMASKSCNLTFGGPSDQSSGSPNLGVPYRAQENPVTLCGPASIQMWAAYDGRQATQQEIANAIGCSARSAEDINQTALGVRIFTRSADAYPEYNGGVEGSDSNFLARQVTSINNRVPIIAQLAGFGHRGIINGGSWHRTANGLNSWDFVFFHDPLTGPNIQYSAGDWKDLVVAHVISSAATSGWNYNLSTYGSSIRLYGSDYVLTPSNNF
jgi:hypothetical protein